MIGENLKKIRINRKLSRKRLGELSGVQREYISQLESGKYSNPTLNVICRLCKTLKVTPNEFIPEELYRSD